MAIVLSVISDKLALVHSSDPCVHPVKGPLDVPGWLPLCDAQIDDGATIVEIRPLPGVVLLQTVAHDNGEMQVQTCMRGVVSVDGQVPVEATIRGWAWDVLKSLYTEIQDISRGPTKARRS